MTAWPENVGIHAIELIFPSRYVDQTELEKFDGASSGKYTVGLGQERMGFCNDREDVNSLCLTVVHKLLERNGVSFAEIGRLEVGTETIIDKSKSVKTVLMQLFEPHGVTDLEGIDTTNACYGGTAALFNALSWVESSYWNGRYALVVCADIAVYAQGPARPTGGAGAVAMLIGANAPLVFDRGLRATYMKHAYDFYKPDLTSEYPIVDGRLSIECYLNALDMCYALYSKKYEKQTGRKMELGEFDAVLCHSPYGKLVEKSIARLVLNDFIAAPKAEIAAKFPGLEKLKDTVQLKNSYFDRDVEKSFINHSKELFKSKTKPGLLVASQVGNMYTPSLYGALVSLLVSKEASALAGERVGLFSYGSGLASSMFSITISSDCSEGSPLQKLVSKLDYVKPLLAQRKRVAPEDFTAILKLREKVSHLAPYTPVADLEEFFPGTYYLSEVDEMHRRKYERVPGVANGNA